MIPTAEEFLKKLDEEKGTVWSEEDDEICIAFREFAKMHVEAALKSASEQAELYRFNEGWKATKQGIKVENCMNYNVGIDKDSILNAYPLENI